MTSIGVLLAAGTGSRFDDGNKLCQTIDGEPIVRRAARRLVRSPVEETVVVLGYEADHVLAALNPLVDDLAIIRNDCYREGQGTSVRLGAQAVLDRDGTHGLFALGDMPWVARETYAQLLDAASNADAPITVPVTDGQRGNPVVFNARVLHEFETLDGDTGGRALFEAFPVSRLPVDDSGVHADVDTVADLEQ